MPKTKQILRFLLGVIALLTPLYFVRFSLVGIPFSLPEVLIYLATASYLFYLLTSDFYLTWRTNRGWILLVWAMVIIISFLSIVDLPSEVVFENEIYFPIKTALGIWKGWLIAPFLYFLLILQLCPDRSGKALLKRGFILGATALSLYSLFLGDWSPDGRMLGMFTNPNYLALYLAPALWVVIEEILFNKNSHFSLPEKIIYLIILSVGVALTRSYGAVLALGLIALLRAMLIFRGWKRWVILGVFLLGIGGFFVKEYNSAKFTQSFEFEERSSMSVRMQIWEVAGDLALRNPFNGVGMGQFQINYWQNAWDKLGQEPYEWNISHTHNLYLQWLVETGIFGLLFFLLFVFLVLRHNPFDEGIDLRFALGVILLHGMLDMPFWKQDLAIEFMLICGLIVAGNYLTVAKVKMGEKRRTKQVGYPSANFDSKLFWHYEEGMYTAWIYWRGQRFPALGFIGIDAVEGGTRRAEFHLLDLDTDIYGENVKIEIIEKVRDKRKYDKNSDRKKQLDSDYKNAKKYFSHKK